MGGGSHHTSTAVGDRGGGKGAGRHQRSHALAVGLQPAAVSCSGWRHAQAARWAAVEEKRKELIIHLGMTGSISVTEKKSNDPYVRAEWELDNGLFFTFRDIRRFGRIAFVDPGNYKSLPTLNSIGPEPFDPDLTSNSFYKSLSSSKSQLKTKLLSQRVVAGLGNIYVDESLWRARVNPAVRRIGERRSEILLLSIREVLNEAIINGGTTFRDYRTPDGLTGKNQHNLDCYGKTGQPCKNCSTTLKGRLIGQRSTTWCPQCQIR